MKTTFNWEKKHRAKLLIALNHALHLVQTAWHDPVAFQNHMGGVSFASAFNAEGNGMKDDKIALPATDPSAVSFGLGAAVQLGCSLPTVGFTTTSTPRSGDVIGLIVDNLKALEGGNPGKNIHALRIIISQEAEIKLVDQDEAIRVLTEVIAGIVALEDADKPKPAAAAPNGPDAELEKLIAACPAPVIAYITKLREENARLQPKPAETPATETPPAVTA